MNILHVTTFLQGGAGRILTDMACLQKSLGNNVIVITDDNPIDGYETYPMYSERLKNNDIDLLTVQSFFRRDLALNIKASQFIRDVIAKQKITIIHAHSAIPAFTGLLARSSVEHFVPLLMSMQGFGENKRPDQISTDVTTMNMVDKVVPVSHASAEHLISIGVNPLQLKVIHNAIPQQEMSFLTSLINKEDLLWRKIEEWNNKNIPIIGCIGTICNRKNQSCLVRALAHIKDQNYRCLLIGEEEEPGVIKDLIDSLDLKEKVIVTGYRNDAQAILAKLRCLILPSLSEGLPLTIIEAFREGIPVIGSDIKSIAELITHGKTGMLFRSGDYHSLTQMLVSVFNDSKELESITKNAHSSFKKKFSLDKMISKYSTLYETLLKKCSLGKNDISLL